MTKCSNCEENDKDETYYKYLRKTYCLACLEEYFHDELVDAYFDKFLEEDCQEIK